MLTKMFLAVAHPISVRLLLISLNIFASKKSSFRTIQHHLKHLLLVDQCLLTRTQVCDQLVCVGEVLQRITGKVVMSMVKDNVTKKVEILQLCGGKDAGCKAAIHSMHDIFGTNKTEAVLLVDAENTFSSINRQIM